jgi:phenylacetate-CoA ligase
MGPMTAEPTTSELSLAARVGEFIARDEWDRQTLMRYQRERLRELIEHAVAHSPYYRETLGEDAAEAPLQELPILTKATMMERFDELVTDPRLRRAPIEAHLSGREPGADYAGEYALVTTSGTTGARGVFAYERRDMTVSLAATLRILGRLGVGPGTRVVGIGSPSPLFMSRRVFAGLQAGAAERPPDLSVLTPIPQLVASLNDYRPEALVGYPTVIAMLAEEQLAGRLRIEPRAVGVGSEVLAADQEARILAAWDAALGNAYVATEVCPIAASCPERVGLHVCEDMAVVEVVDSEGRPVAPGVPGDRVLVTNLVNRAQPLIRYEISDSVTLAEGPNPTGMPWRRLAAVDGRVGEILRLRGDGGREVDVHPHRLRGPLATAADVLQYQFAFDGDRLTVALVLRSGAEPGTAEAVRAGLERVLRAAGAVGVSIEARVVPEIAREPGGAAKLKQVKVTAGA